MLPLVDEETGRPAATSRGIAPEVGCIDLQTLDGPGLPNWIIIHSLLALGAGRSPNHRPYSSSAGCQNGSGFP